MGSIQVLILATVSFLAYSKRGKSSSIEQPIYQSCNIDNKEYEDGEVIRDVRHQCLGWGAAAKSFTITQEVCVQGEVKEETFEGLCDYGQCCQFGDFVGCTEGECDPPKGRSCFFAGHTFEDGDIMEILGYTCMGRGAAQSRLTVSETVCRDGEIKVENRDIPCGNGWACCQVGKSAMCAPDWQQCEETPAARLYGGRSDSYKDSSSSGSWSSSSSGYGYGAGTETVNYIRRSRAESIKSKIDSLDSDRYGASIGLSRVLSRSRSRSLDRWFAKEGKEEKDEYEDVMEVYAIAQFEKNDVSGDVVIDENGNVEINLDLSSFDLKECDNDKVLKIAIYNEWNDEEKTEAYGEDCTMELIGKGIFDPFGTGKYCDKLEENENIDYFSCSIGDVSGRFGVLTIDENNRIEFEENISYESTSKKDDGFCSLRITPEAVYRRSVVFMCDDEEETVLFCAPFVIKVDDEGK